MEAVSEYLKKEKGYNLKRMASSEANGELTVRAQVGIVSDDKPMFSKQKEIKVRKMPSFKRKNLHLFKHLGEYFDDLRKRGKKQVSFAETLKEMQIIYPDTLNARLFSTYMYDKPRQDKYKFRYDSITKTISLNP